MANLFVVLSMRHALMGVESPGNFHSVLGWGTSPCPPGLRIKEHSRETGGVCLRLMMVIFLGRAIWRWERECDLGFLWELGS